LLRLLLLLLLLSLLLLLLLLRCCKPLLLLLLSVGVGCCCCCCGSRAPHRTTREATAGPRPHPCCWVLLGGSALLALQERLQPQQRVLLRVPSGPRAQLLLGCLQGARGGAAIPHPQLSKPSAGPHTLLLLLLLLVLQQLLQPGALQGVAAWHYHVVQCC
jgi:hypothetical protein